MVFNKRHTHIARLWREALHRLTVQGNFHDLNLYTKIIKKEMNK